MYERISIQNFRGLKELTIERLAPINILIGNNGSGKSTALEAMWLHADPNGSLLDQIDAFRNFDWDSGEAGLRPAPWQHLFYGYGLKEHIVISGRADGRSWTMKLRQVPEVEPPSPIQGRSSGAGEGINRLRFPRELIFELQNERGETTVSVLVARAEQRFKPTNQPISWITPTGNAALLSSPSSVLADIAVRFGEIDRRNKQDSVIKVARILEPSLKRIASIPRRDGKSYLYADIGQKELLPVQLIGGGFVSVLSIAIIAVDMESGLLLIDEIENGIHYSALESLWKGIWGLYQETGVQIVATTHSLECVEAARAALLPEAFLVHRLERDRQTGKVRVGSLDAGMLQGAAEMGLEVR